jgi:SAM-dependent methyltransferase
MSNLDFANLLKTPDNNSVFWKSLELWPNRPGKALLRAIEAQLYLVHQIASPILDAGCGDGKFASLLNFTVDFGVEIDSVRAATSISHAKILQTIGGDLRKLPFAKNSIATIICNSTLEHIPDLERVLNELNRVTKPNGTLMFTVPTPQKREHLFFTYYKKEDYLSYFDKYWQHLHYLDAPQWELVLKDAGFNLVTYKGYETSHLGKLIDLLESISVSYKEWSHTGEYVTSTWCTILYNLLGPYASSERPKP